MYNSVVCVALKYLMYSKDAVNLACCHSFVMAMAKGSHGDELMTAGGRWMRFRVGASPPVPQRLASGRLWNGLS